MLKDILITFFYLFFFNCLIYRFRVFQFKNFRPFVTHLLYNLKFLSGICIWIIYTYYYTDTAHNDVHKFYDNAMALRDIAEVKPKAFVDLMLTGTTLENVNTTGLKNWNRNFDELPFNENRAIIKLNALLLFISFKTYFVHILFFSFFSMLGWILLVDSLFSFSHPKIAVLAIPILLLPSVLLWTSGVMKEAILVLGIGMYIKALYSNKTTLQAVLLFISGAAVILFTKFFVIICAIPATISYILFKRKTEPQLVFAKYILIHAILIIGIFFLPRPIHSIDFKQVLINKQTNAIREASYFKANSLIEIPVLDKTNLSFIKSAIAGVWNTTLRPFLWETRSNFMLLSALENVFIIGMLLIAFRCISWKNFRQANAFMFLLTFSISFFTLIGMVTPVLGNMVRYKAPFIPIFLLAFATQFPASYISDRLQFLVRK